jgi:hypothetical protein
MVLVDTSVWIAFFREGSSLAAGGGKQSSLEEIRSKRRKGKHSCSGMRGPCQGIHIDFFASQTADKILEVNMVAQP